MIDAISSSGQEAGFGGIGGRRGASETTRYSPYGGREAGSAGSAPANVTAPEGCGFGHAARRPRPSASS
ncbi:MAG: hypothetical protein R3322_10830, partial [Kiloniellales bacterium]|nr:hypothetical protein [Kiloniellales bacterium]